MKTSTVVLAVAALATLSTAAFAEPSTGTDISVARQVVLGNVKASNDGAGQSVVEGRQAARSTTFADADRLLVEMQFVRDKNMPVR